MLIGTLPAREPSQVLPIKVALIADLHTLDEEYRHTCRLHASIHQGSVPLRKFRSAQTSYRRSWDRFLPLHLITGFKPINLIT